MNKVPFVAAITASLLCFVSTTQAANPSAETILRCFFVYAPILETGEDLRHHELFQFGQARVGWIGGYNQANQFNPEYKRVFEANLAANKRIARELKKSLTKAVKSRNQSLFSSVIDEAISCDRSIGITTKFIPKI
ncbi:MAG: hypothetical protein ACYCWB_04515 [Thiobacillus sp.]